MLTLIKRVFYTVLILIMCASSYAAERRALDNKLIAGLKSGQYVLLMRHALAPGVGDPENFDVNDCLTQRNLSNRGRNQAERIGEYLKQSGLVSASVFSSQWCRCLETAKLLNFGHVTELSTLNSFFQRFQHREMQTDGLKIWLKQYQQNAIGPVILVTHQVNITALTEIFPESGELVVIEPTSDGSISVIAQIKTEV